MQCVVTKAPFFQASKNVGTAGAQKELECKLPQDKAWENSLAAEWGFSTVFVQPSTAFKLAALVSRCTAMKSAKVLISSGFSIENNRSLRISCPTIKKFKHQIKCKTPSQAEYRKAGKPRWRNLVASRRIAHRNPGPSRAPLNFKSQWTS